MERTLHLGQDLSHPESRDHISELKKGRTQHGEREPVVKAKFPDGHLETLNGRHREAAGWKSVKVVLVKDRLDFLQQRVDYMNQRRHSEAEWAEIFTAYAEELERQKTVPTEKIAKYVLEHLSPFEIDFTYRNIPRKYKDLAHGGRPPTGFGSVETPNEMHGDLPPGVSFANDQPQGPELVKCSHCEFRGVVVSSVLVEQN